MAWKALRLAGPGLAKHAARKTVCWAVGKLLGIDVQALDWLHQLPMH